MAAKEKSRRVLKTQLKHLVPAGDGTLASDIISDAVDRCHDICERSYFLAKHYLLTIFHARDDFDADAVASDWPDVFDTDFFQACFRSVATKDSRGPKTTNPHQQRLRDAETALRQSGCLGATKPSARDLQFSLDYVATQMKTSFNNNVLMRYGSYVNAVCDKVFKAYEAGRLGAEGWDLIPHAMQQTLLLSHRRVKRALFASDPSRLIVAERTLYDLYRRDIAPAAPIQRPPNWTICWDVDARRLQYLACMVRMNLLLEGAGRRLKSPFPLRTSFVPCSIHMDTMTIVSLLVPDKAAAIRLKNELELCEYADDAKELLWQLPNIDGKDAFKKSPSKLVSDDLLVRLEGDAFVSPRLRTSIWKTLTSMGRSKHTSLGYKGLVFNNSIDTDGYSVSLHYAHPRRLLGSEQRFHALLNLLTDRYLQIPLP